MKNFGFSLIENTDKYGQYTLCPYEKYPDQS